MIVDGWPIYSFMEKLRRPKVFLKGWNKKTFGNTFFEKQALLDKINSLDLLEQSGPFNEANVVEREECRGALLDAIVKVQRIWVHKCKSVALRGGGEFKLLSQADFDP